jgi:hypothetical protein
MKNKAIIALTLMGGALVALTGCQTNSTSVAGKGNAVASTNQPASRVSASQPGLVPAVDVTDTWQAQFDTQRGLQNYTFTFKQNGTSLTGSGTAELNVETRQIELQNGKVEGDTVSFVEPLSIQGNEISITYTGKVSADGIKFTRAVGDFGSSEAVAKRAAAVAPAQQAAMQPAPTAHFSMSFAM